MRHIKKILLFFCIQIFLLSSCGVDTKDWPNITLNFDSSEIVEATIYYQRNKNDYVEYLEDSLTFNSKEDFEKLISSIQAYPIKEEKEKSIETQKYATKIVISFLLVDSYVNKMERLLFYGYGISNGKVMLNNGEVHFIPGCIDYIYEEMKKA